MGLLGLQVRISNSLSKILKKCDKNSFKNVSCKLQNLSMNEMEKVANTDFSCQCINGQFVSANDVRNSQQSFSFPFENKFERELGRPQTMMKCLLYLLKCNKNVLLFQGIHRVKQFARKHIFTEMKRKSRVMVFVLSGTFVQYLVTLIWHDK